MLHIPRAHMAAHGTFLWNELNTRNPDAAKTFYAATLGWTFDGMPMPDGTYWVIKMGDASVGGIFTVKGAEKAAAKSRARPAGKGAPTKAKPKRRT